MSIDWEKRKVEFKFSKNDLCVCRHILGEHLVPTNPEASGPCNNPRCRCPNFDIYDFHPHASLCACGHYDGEHKEDVDVFTGDPCRGVCLLSGCECTGFESQVTKPSLETTYDKVLHHMKELGIEVLPGSVLDTVCQHAAVEMDETDKSVAEIMESIVLDKYKP